MLKRVTRIAHKVFRDQYEGKHVNLKRSPCVRKLRSEIVTYGYRVKDNELVKLKYGLICAAMDTVLTLQTNKREWGGGRRGRTKSVFIERERDEKRKYDRQVGDRHHIK